MLRGLFPNHSLQPTAGRPAAPAKPDVRGCPEEGSRSPASHKALRRDSHQSGRKPLYADYAPPHRCSGTYPKARHSHRGLLGRECYSNQTGPACEVSTWRPRSSCASGRAGDHPEPGSGLSGMGVRRVVLRLTYGGTPGAPGLF